MLQAIKGQRYIGDRPIRRIRICGRREHDIEINDRTNEVRFRLQYGPRKQIGDQGCDIDHILNFCRDIIIGLDNELPCDQNQNVILAIASAIEWLEDRRRDRTARGVEGTSKP